ncbi:hypothetical protein [Alteribacillus sp. HJP-4]|uniref:hypothetical protein n=1 Tax=Alteribacillus sp. HJP-4 TaxID=2775394 RepID=UPI0035CCCAF5
MPIFRLLLIVSSKTLSKLFTMATASFFGRIPSKDDSKITLVGFLSVYWVFMLFAVAIPEFAAEIIPFVPENEAIILAVAFALILIIPLICGGITLYIENQENAWYRQLIMGYVYTAIVGPLVIMLVVIVPSLKIPQILQLKSFEHIAIMVKKGEYDQALEKLTSTLENRHIHLQKKNVPIYLRIPFQWLIWVQENIFNRDMPKKMTILQGKVDGKELEIVMHATDISIIGEKETVKFATAILFEYMDITYLYYSWDDTSQQLEDEINNGFQRLETGQQISEGEINDLLEKLQHLEVSSEEWNAIRRQLFKLEVEMYKSLQSIRELKVTEQM